MRNFLKALLVCGLVTLTGVLLDRILRSGGIPGRYLLDLSNLLTGAFAGALFYYATREQAIPSLGAVPLPEKNQRATAAGMPARISSTAAKAASISSSWL